MCTTTDDNRPRTLHELLLLETYQGMTDEEIDTIIEYKINYELTRTETLAKIDAIEARERQTIEDQRAVLMHSQSMLQSMIESGFNIEEPIQRLTFEPYVVGV